MVTITREQWNELVRGFNIISEKLDNILAGFNPSASKSSSDNNENPSKYEENTSESNCEIVKKKNNDSTLRTFENIGDKIDQSQNDQKITSKLKAIKKLKKKCASKKNSNVRKKTTRIRLREPSVNTRPASRSSSIFALVLKLEETRRLHRKKKVKCDDGG
jgi:hypothetical protein